MHNLEALFKWVLKLLLSYVTTLLKILIVKKPNLLREKMYDKGMKNIIFS